MAASQGRLVNIQNYSLSTIASVIKKFLRKVIALLSIKNSPYKIGHIE